MNPLPLTGADIAREPMPRLVYAPGRHVSSQSLHKKNYTGQLRVWGGFKNDVWNFWKEESSNCRNILAWKSDNPAPNDIRNEQYRCGEEISTSGRYANNGLHPATAVGKELGHNTEYGDWKATKGGNTAFKHGEDGLQLVAISKDAKRDEDGSNRKRDNATAKGQKDESSQVIIIPDYALMDEEGTPRAVGEAKTPWNHDFIKWWSYFQDLEDSKYMDKLLGQILNYMLCLGLKYGFVTNYRETFFLKQSYEEVSGGLKEVLYCSPPISYKMEGNDRAVSVRQCLVYLQRLVMSNWEFNSRRGGRVALKGKHESTKDFIERIDRQSEQENAPTPIKPRDIRQLPGGNAISPFANKYGNYDPKYLAQSVEEMDISSQDDYGYTEKRKGHKSLTGDRSRDERSSRPRKDRKSVMIDEDTEEYEHGYSSQIFASYQPRGGSRTAYTASTTPASRQGYPASTAPYTDNAYTDASYTHDPYSKTAYASNQAAALLSSSYGHESYVTSAVSQAHHMGSGQGHGYTSSVQGYLGPNYGERGEGPRHSRSPSGRSPEDRSRESTHERSSRSRRELELEPEPEPTSNLYGKPRNRNHRLEKDKYNKYSRNP